MAIDGTAGNDTLNGTAGDDTINGLSGDDTINGLAGNDTIDGGDGDDTIDGGDGNDVIYGGIGQDFIHGGNGDDIIHAGPNGNYPSPQAPAPEYIWDGPGNDTVTAMTARTSSSAPLATTIMTAAPVSVGSRATKSITPVHRRESLPICGSRPIRSIRRERPTLQT